MLTGTPDQHLYPSQQLALKIAHGTLKHDPAQAKIALLLDRLIDDVMAAAAPSLGAHLKALVTRRSSFADIKGLYIYGGVGRGKTMLMDMFFQALAARADIGASTPLVWRLHFHDFMVLAQDVIHAARNRNADDPIEEAAAVLAHRGKVVCFDEMEVRDIADAMILARLFGSMLRLGTIVLATSNRQVDDLYKNGLHRDRFLPFIELLKARCMICQLDDGTDWRGAMLAALPAWHCPVNAVSDAALDTAFETLVGHAEVASDTVRVAGRDIVFDKVAGDVGYVSFASLCDVPLAARDYLAIAGRFAGLVMANIPRFTTANENAARRFMWLIDALYDRNRFLIASAEDKIESLYHGDQWHFEFSRTTSRLGEMTQRGHLHQ